MNRTLIILAIVLLAGITLAYSVWLGSGGGPGQAPASPGDDAGHTGDEWRAALDPLPGDPLLDEDEPWHELDPEDDVVAPAERTHRTRTLAELWDELVPRALDGDTRAAFSLFRALDRCRRFNARDADDETWRQRLADVAPERADHMMARVQALRSNCRDMTPERLDTALDWLTQAADFGHTDAKILWAARARHYLDMADEETRAWHDRNAARYLGEARDAGSFQAMQMIARRDLRDDPQNAWAHLALTMRVLDERATAAALAGRDTSHAYWQLRLQALLDDAGARLGDRQLAAAQQKADELYERCCRR